MMTECKVPVVTETSKEISAVGIHDALERAAFIAAVQEGLADFDRGEYISFEEHQKEFYSWFTE